MADTVKTSASEDAAAAQALALRLFVASLGAAELMAAYLGTKLGLYEALVVGPGTHDTIAKRAGVSARYAREWLEQQTAAGIVQVDDPTKPVDSRVFSLPRGHAEALTKPDSPNWVVPMTLLPVGGIAPVLPSLLEAYRTGRGVPYAAYGEDFRGGQAELNRAVFTQRLAPWIREHLPDVHRQLSRPGSRVVDIGCGAGWSTIALAVAYPRAEVLGIDLDEASIADAVRNAQKSGLSGRVRFEARSAVDSVGPSGFDLVCMFDALHDMPHPVATLQACRGLCKVGAPVLLMEPKAAEQFSPHAGEIERFLYAVSLLHCLPVGMHEEHSAGTGTVLRPDTLKAYALQAGFTRVTVLGAEHRFHRLYRLDDVVGAQS